MKMCQSFTELGYSTNLLISINKNTSINDLNHIFNDYGIDSTFSLTIIKDFQNKNKWLINKFANIFYGYSIFKIIRSWFPDIVYGRYLVGCYISCMLGIPTIYESHSKIWNHKIENLLFKIMLHNDSFVKLVVISESLKILYKKKFNIRNEQIIVAHDGADPNPDSNIINPWPGHNGYLQVGYTGSVYRGRGIRLLVQLAERMPNVDFHFIGANKQEVGSITGIYIPDNLICHGRVPHSTIYRYLNGCDVLLAPYQNEVQIFGGGGNTSDIMSPLKIFEYMASGKTIIASDLSVLHEILDTKCAIFAKPDCVEEWIKAIEKSKDIQLRNSLGKAAFIRFTNNHSWKQRAEMIMSKSFS
jgi:glycosyltransferase involved in cell wall biosynthesis